MKEYRLGDIIDIKHGYAFDGDHIVQEDNGIVLVTPGNFRIGGGFQEEKCKFFTGEIPDDYVLSAGDFIVTMTDLSKEIDTLGYSAIVPDTNRTYLHNQRIGLVSFKNNECHPGYIYFLMRTHQYQRSIANTSTGATVHHTSPSKICDYQFYAPSYEKQRRIAEYLFVYEKLTENNQKQIKLLEEAAQRLYKEWFIDLRFPGHETTPIVDGVPAGWKKVGLASIAPIVTGKKDANFGTADGKYLFFTCAQEPIKAPSYSFDCDAVILAGNGDFNVKLYRGQFEAYQRTYVFSPYDKDHLYLLYHAVRESMRQLFQGASGSTIKFLTKHMLEDILVHIPEDSILQAYNSNCEAIQKKIECLKNQIISSQEARDRLLPKLMSGEIEVQEVLV